MKAAGEESIVLLRDLTEAVFRDGVIPKGKDDALDHGNYRGLKLTDQAMKLLECVLDTSISRMVNVDSLRFGYVPGQTTSDAIFIIR